MTDVFDTTTTTGEQDNSNQTTTETTEQKSSLLEELVGEDKKYKTPEDLAKSRIEADQFIEKLKEENAGMREELQGLQSKVEKSKTIDELMELVTKASSSTEESGNQPDAFSKEDLEKLIEGKIHETKTQETRANNRKQANEAVLERFGGDASKAAEFVRDRANTLGMEVGALKDMAETSPLAFKQLLGLSDKPASPQGGSVRSFQDKNSDANFNPGGERNSAYYSNLRKEMGARFWDPKVQQQMFEDRKRLGDRFFSS